MRYKIKVLSPLHIGCGDMYNGLNYIVNKKRLYYINPEKFLALLGKNTDRFVTWIEAITQKIDYLEKQKRETRDRGQKQQIDQQLWPVKDNFNINKFCTDNSIPVNKVCDSAVYSIDCMESISDAKDVNSFIKQMNKAYIPGTEIKGAIRTAILYSSVLDSPGIYEWLKNEINKFGIKHRNSIDDVMDSYSPDRRTKNLLEKEMGKIEEKLQEKVFNSMQNDAKYDFMKYVYVGDSHVFEPDKVLSIAYAQPYNTGRTFTIFYEFMKPDSELFLTDLKIEGKNAREIKTEKMDFNTNQKNIISSTEQIFKCCYRFTSDLLKEEINYYEKHKLSDIVSHLNSIVSKNKPETPVIRIGKDEGYLSLTTGLAVKNKNPELYENILIHATKGKSYTGNNLMPKSRKIVHYNGKKYTAGWVQIIPVK